MSVIYSENALKIYKNLYLSKGEETPKDCHKRVASFIGNTKEEESDFFGMLHNKIFRPNTPCLIHAGIIDKEDYNNQLCACFVLDLEDSMQSIINLWKTCSLIYASGGGAGFRITALREKGSPLSSGGAASGPLAYLKVCETVSNTVKSGGRHRRAANLGAYDYNHPDVFEITNIKKQNELQSFNLSMIVDDWFMQQVSKKQPFGIDMKSPNPIVKFEHKIKGHILWKNVVNNAWTSGDPGLLFIDNINKWNTIPSMRIYCTNPCGEIPLMPNSTCVLGGINLSKFIYTLEVSKETLFNWELFQAIVSQGVTFLDNIIDKTSFISDEFKENMLKYRPIGLGIMGFADLLVKLNIEYGSEESINLFSAICKCLNLTAIRTSLKMARIGKKPCYIPETDNDRFIEILRAYGCNNENIKDYQTYGIRNSNWTSIAPTGSTSISADCSYSFEPLTAVVWQKELAETHEIMTFVHPEFEKWLNNFAGEYGDEHVFKESLIKNIIENHKGSIQGIPEIPEEIQKIFKTMHDIDPITKLKMQSAGQRYISMGISSTCNLPNSATEEEIENIFITAWQLGLKGITVYRDGCKPWQPMNFGKKADNNEQKKSQNAQGILTEEHEREISPMSEEKPVEINHHIITDKIERPRRRPGECFELKTPKGKLYITLTNTEDRKPLEVWLSLGEHGSHENLLYDTIARLLSTNLQRGVPVKDLISTLRKSKEDKFWFSSFLKNSEEVHAAESTIDALAIIMEEYFIKENIVIENNISEPLQEKDIEYSHTCSNKCPKCGNYTLEFGSGCRGGQCTECGFSNCS